RAAVPSRERRAGSVVLTRHFDGEIEIDWVRNENIDAVDPRVVRGKADGLIRLTFVSHLRVVRCGDGRKVESVEPQKFLPENPLEEFGVEDPRITWLDGRYYFTYVAVARGRGLAGDLPRQPPATAAGRSRRLCGRCAAARCGPSRTHPPPC